MIGTMQCPLCGFRGMRVAEQKAEHHRAKIYCDACEFDGYARGPKSDRAIRTRMSPLEGGDPDQEGDRRGEISR